MSKNRSISLVKLPKTELTPPQDGVVMRRKSAGVVGGGAASSGTLTRAKKSGRRISCKELGAGDIEGWLYTRKQNKSKWDTYHKWCVLKSSDLYIYNSQMDTQASSKIHLPLFMVSEAVETKKKTAFKVYNHGTSFYFRTDKEADKYKWINMLSLAAIEYKVMESKSPVSSHLTASQSGGSYCSTLTSSSNPGYSDESDEEASSETYDDQTDLVMTRPRSRNTKFAPDRVTLTAEGNPEMRKVIESIHQADLDVLGADSESRRKSAMRQSLARYTLIVSEITRSTSFKSNLHDRRKIKRAKVKALQKELDDINYLFDTPTSNKIKNFLTSYPRFLTLIEPANDNPDQSRAPSQSNNQSIKSSLNDQSDLTSSSVHSVRDSFILSTNYPIIMSPILETDLDNVDHSALAELNQNNSSNSDQLQRIRLTAETRATSDPNLMNHCSLLSPSSEDQRRVSAESSEDQRRGSAESAHLQVYKDGKKHIQLSTEL